MSSERDLGDDELDARLTELFADDRLAVPPAPDAARVVAAGARRVRRRRTMLVGGTAAACALALVGGGVLVNVFGTSSSPTSEMDVAAPPADTGAATESGGRSAETSSTNAPPSAPAVPAPPGGPSTARGSEPSSGPASGSEDEQPPTTASAGVTRQPLGLALLGPAGYADLSLGMSFSEARATGMLAPGQPPPSGGGCTSYPLAGSSPAVQDVTISATQGIVAFEGGDARTPEGIGAGSSLDQARASYPDLTQEGAGYSAAAGGSARYFFTTTNDTVDAVNLRSASSPC